MGEKAARRWDPEGYCNSSATVHVSVGYFYELIDFLISSVPA